MLADKKPYNPAELLQNPDSPQTKEFLKQFMNLLASEVLRYSVMFQILSDAYLFQLQELMKEKKEFREQKIAEEAKNQALIIEDLEKRSEAAGNDPVKLRELQNVIEQKIVQYQQQETELLKSIETSHTEIRGKEEEILKVWVTEKSKAKTLLNNILDPAKFDKVSEDDKKRLGITEPLKLMNAKGEEVDSKVYVDKLKEDHESTFNVLKNRLLELLTQNTEKSPLDKVVARAMVQKETLNDHLNRLFLLAEGNITPSQMVQLDKNNRALSQIVQKLHDPNVEFKAKQLEELTNLVKELKEKERDLATNRNQTQEMQKVLDKINKTLEETNVHTMKPK